MTVVSADEPQVAGGEVDLTDDEDRAAADRRPARPDRRRPAVYRSAPEAEPEAWG